MKYDPLLHIVLYQPEIPQNTGNIGRTCVAVGAKLWLVRPLGFRLDDRHLARAGLDYWEHLEWEAVDDWAALLARLGEASTESAASSNTWYFTKTAARLYTDVQFQRGDVLVFGRETSGLPPSLLEAAADHALRLPMRPQVRSLNLGSCVSAAAYEAVRQISASA